MMFSRAVSVGSRLNAWNTKPIALAAQPGELAVGQRAEVDVADEHLAGRERVEPGEAVHQRALARARRAHDRGERGRRGCRRSTSSRARTSVPPRP